MRLVLAVALVLPLTGAGTGTSALPRCARDLPHLQTGPPVALSLTTDCARFRLEPDGRLAFAGAYTLPVPPEARSWSPFDLSWSGVDHGHLVIGRGMQHFWRSRAAYRGRADVQPVLGRSALAFEYVKGTKRSALYYASYGGAEHLIAHSETPLVFTHGKLVTEVEGVGGALIVRGSDRRRERVLASHPSATQVDWEGNRVLFRSKGRLFVYDGVRVRDLVSLGKLGLTGMLTIEPLGRVVAVHDRRRLVVLDHDGRLVASTPLPRTPSRADGISSAVVANPAGTAVAFTATNGNTAYGSTGSETVYVLLTGERRARPVFSAHVMFKVCERMADVAWRGGLILYSNAEHNAAVIDSSGRTAPLELSRLVARLPGLRPDSRFDVAWA